VPKATGFHEEFARALAGVSPRVVTLDEVGSTMDEARVLARAGALPGTAVVADHQTAGRGRFGRGWVSPPGLGLHASWVVRPALPIDRWTLIPLLAGVAVAEAVRARTGVEATLKWPNDLLVGARKLGGILVEAEVPEFLVVGLGINVSHLELPEELRETATSLALEGAVRLDRADLFAATLAGFARALADVPEALARYQQLCATLGERVRIERVGAEPLEGVARDVDPSGALVLESAGERLRVASGDVVHLRGR
jgi:BirA family biotin operon repressor/biotin-[acetyl-CoA-carboxylase] ligase